jgi:hypothetical protein
MCRVPANLRSIGPDGNAKPMGASWSQRRLRLGCVLMQRSAAICNGDTKKRWKLQAISIACCGS